LKLLTRALPPMRLLLDECVPARLRKAEYGISAGFGLCAGRTFKRAALLAAFSSKTCGCISKPRAW